MVDALCQEARMQFIPVRGFIGIDRAALGNTIADNRNASSFGSRDEWQRLAVSLAHDDNDAPLASLVFTETAISAVIFPIGRASVAAEMPTVHFDVAGSLLPINASRHRLAKLHCEHVSGFVIAR